MAQEDSWLTWKALVDELCRVCVDDVERVRVLFRWVSTKNLALLDIDAGVPTESLLGTLRTVKYGVRSYHELFKRLCHYSGIICEIIHGYSKGAGYTPGALHSHPPPRYYSTERKEHEVRVHLSSLIRPLAHTICI